MVKDPPANAGGAHLIPGLGRSPGGGEGNPVQYSCVGKPRDRGAWWAIHSPWAPKESDTAERLNNSSNTSALNLFSCSLGVRGYCV